MPSTKMAAAVSAVIKKAPDVEEVDHLWVAIGKAHRLEEHLLRWITESRRALGQAEKDLASVRARKKDLLNQKLRHGRYAQGPA